MRSSIRYLGGMAFEGLTPSGHTVLMDADPSAGGSDKGPRPMELVLLALAGCTAMDVVSILTKRRLSLSSYSVDVEAERASTHPRVYTALVINHRIAGRDLHPDDVEMAVRLSATKYCSVSAMLKCTAEIVHKFTLIDEMHEGEISKVVHVEPPGGGS